MPLDPAYPQERLAYMLADSETSILLSQRALLSNLPSSHAIVHAYEAALGARLMQQGKYFDAIPHLQEDHDNAFSMRLLVEAYTRTGAMSEADAQSKLLDALHTPTLDQAVVVVRGREHLAENPQ